MSATSLLQQLREQVSGFGFTDYLRHLKPAEEAATDGKPLRVAVLRSCTVEPLEPVLKLRLLLEGFRPSIWFGGYDQYVQEILDPASALHELGPDIVLMMIRIEDLLPEFIERFPARSASDWEEVLASKAREVAELGERAARDLSAQVIIQNAALTRGYYGVFDAQSADGQGHLVQAFNRALAAASGDLRGVFVWDFDGLVRTKGWEHLRDPKMWYVSRNPFRQSAYPAIVEDLFRYVRSALGRQKKCVVLDLDNTLWGGVAGEDGIDGIQLGHTYPGNCYRDFQTELLKLYDRGILLAINSKNNEEDALGIIDRHPAMVLRRKHFASLRVNWHDKASNLREIARELNIGVDSLIFVDDNAAECELVRRECPECDVVQLPDKPYLLPAVPASLAGIENVRLTEEDRQRGAMYRTQAIRREQEEGFSNLQDFLRSLQMEVTIEAASSFSIPRIAQLTQKTNQMNMTTRRYQEAQIRALASDPAHAVYSVSARDRFGDHGIIGVIILTFVGQSCEIDTFLLSCRVIGRGIEQAMVAFVADIARARGTRTLIGDFFPTAKNKPADGVYQSCGFQRVTETRLQAELHEAACPCPAHIRVTPVVRDAVVPVNGD